MKRNFFNRFTKIAISCLLLLGANVAQAQLPSCAGGGILYMLDGGSGDIYNYDPALPPSGTNPVVNTLPTFGFNAGGISVGPNINGAGPSPTFYMVDLSQIYHYFDGTSWVSTGHNAGAVNIASAGQYIYGLIGGTGEVYRYDGTGNATLITTIVGYVGPYDLVGKANGNFYALNTSSVMALQEYDPTGALVNSWSLVGLPAGTGAGGFAVNGCAVYCDGTDFSGNGAALYEGTLSGTTVTFNPPIANVAPPISIIYDFASCADAGTDLLPDTIYQCLGAAPVTLNAAGNGTSFTWSVISGPAVLSANTGNPITVTSPTAAISQIEVVAASVNTCGSGTDTVTLLVPVVNVNAGPDDTIFGCGTYADTLHGKVVPNISNLNLTYSWSPASAIVSGGNTLDPLINPNGPTQFVLTVTTDAAQGGCSFTDTVNIFTVNSNPIADFIFDIQYGCGEDTVYFTNSSDNYERFTWDFADGTGDTATSPMHIYPNQNTYNVKLIAYNKTCKDSTEKVIDTQHPLEASFTVDNDSVCQGTLITFSNTSNYTTIEGPAVFYWDFGDGTVDTNLGTTHIYPNYGTYTVRMIAKDFVPCQDTAYQLIVVDSMANLNFTTSDSSLCEGQGITFVGDYFEVGLDRLIWDFGDGIFTLNQNPTLHAYDTSGLYTVALIGEYRICPDTTYTKQIEIRPFPSINLGPDTTLCQGGEPLILRDISNFSNPAATWTWNTGDSGMATIVARHPGVYTATVTLNGCSSTDSVTIGKDCYLDIPNAFSPNGDNNNDYFLPRQLLSLGLTGFKMTVYNRWGQEIFNTVKLDGRGWDGKFNDTEQPEGVYIYLIEAMLKNGHTEKYQGNVTLLR